MGPDPHTGGSASKPAARHGELSMSLHARVLDIGLAGLAIESDTRLAPQHDLGLRMGSAAGELELSGRVVWCFFHGTSAAPTGEQRPVYRAGIEFSDVLTQRATDLLRFLEAHAVVTMETRLFGRFRLDEGGPVSLHSRAPFTLHAVDSHAIEIAATLALEPTVGTQATVQLAGRDRSDLVTISAAARAAEGDLWRLTLQPVERDPALIERARALLAT